MLSRGGGSAVTRRSLSLVILLLRVIASIVAVQVSGAAPVVMDVAPLVFDVAFDHDDCSEDGGDDDCPPGCPNCHCSHNISALPACPVVIGDTHEPTLGATWSPHTRTEMSSGPDLGCVYRPPKAA